MLGRRNKPQVIAEVPASSNGGSRRPGGLGRNQLQAFSALAARMVGSGPVLLTGPAKSNAALGLAAASTAEGRRVALLECDLAAPSLANALHLEHTPGLHEYLLGKADAAQILQALVLAGPAAARANEPLTCIVAGEPEPEPVALLDSERCDHAIERLRRAYDLLIVDGPPLNEDEDSLRALAEHAGTTLVCGAKREIPKRIPVEATGLVHFG